MTTLSVRVAASSHDVEQLTGTLEINATGGNLDIGRDDVGTHHQNITVVQGQPITNAYIEFTAVASDSGSPVNLTIYAEATDDASVFSTGTGALDALTLTTASVTWNPTAWVIDTTYQSPNIATVIQEVVDRAGWASGNDINIVIMGDGGNRRRGKAYDHTAGAAPLLVIEYTAGAGNQDAEIDVDSVRGATFAGSNATGAAMAAAGTRGASFVAGVIQEDDVTFARAGNVSFVGDQLYGAPVSIARSASVVFSGAVYPARRAVRERLLSIGREY